MVSTFAIKLNRSGLIVHIKHEINKGGNLMVTVVLDSQAGSCGKGKFAGYLAKADNMKIAIDNFMTNAGHTYVSEDGEQVMTQHLPTSLINPNTELVIGPGAAITPRVLFEEIIKYEKMLGDRMVIINPRAVVIKDIHRATEAEVLRSGSTFKGCGAAQADKVMRQAELFGDWWRKFSDNDYEFSDDEDEFNWVCNSGEAEIVKKHIIVVDTMEYINMAINRNENILIEGSQGCDLDINYGLDYPHTTSRQCNASQLVADCGISPRLVDEIVMVMRPYPIRISNETSLFGEKDSIHPLMVSSGDYDGAEEITWDEVRRRCGAPDDVNFGEKTTVTKKTRRVFELNIERLKYVTMLNRPTCIALNFAQYIDWDACGCKSFDELPEKVKAFVDYIEALTGVPVRFIGTGAKNDEIIDRR